MKLFPAIDLFEGEAVRLVKGDYAQKTVYSRDPAAVACGFRDLGAQYIHLVDLEGARSGGTPNFSLIRTIIRESGLRAEIGGGIRKAETVEAYLEAGAMRVILGTAAVENPAFLREMVRAWGSRIAVGVDVKKGCVATHGWTETSARTCLEFCTQLRDQGVSCVICTDISRDGVLAGPNGALYRQLRQQLPDLELVASGGVSCLEDVLRLRDSGLPGTILGKALYEGRLKLEEALKACPQEECP